VIISNEAVLGLNLNFGKKQVAKNKKRRGTMI